MKIVTPLSFFADENFPIPLVRLLRAYLYNEPHIKLYGLEEMEDQGFSRGMSDEEWLAKIGTWTPKPVALCGDGRILERPAQLAALKDAKLHFVYLAEGFANLSWDVLAIKGLQAWNDIVAKTRREKEPHIFMVKVKSCEVQCLKKVADHQCHSEKERKRQPGLTA